MDESALLYLPPFRVPASGSVVIIVTIRVCGPPSKGCRHRVFEIYPFTFGCTTSGGHRVISTWLDMLHGSELIGS